MKMLPQLRQKYMLIISACSLVIFFGCVYNKQELVFVNTDGSINKFYSSKLDSILNHFPSIVARKTEKITSLPNNLTTVIGGTCGRKAFLAGNHQKIYSYALYGNNSRYWKGLTEIVESVESFYPGWFVRIYTDNPNCTYAQELSKNHFSVHICDAMNLPTPGKSLKNYPKMLWRYYPLGDSQVDIVNFRDTDSQVLQRENDAIIQWLNETNKSLHVMRDHPYHGVPILGGMFGVRIKPETRNTWKEIRDKIFKVAYKSNIEKGLDQNLLAQIVWPKFAKDSIGHDSYTCQRFRGSVPFPTQRYNKTYIGAPFYENGLNFVTKICPRQCRPLDHQDWIYC